MQYIAIVVGRFLLYCIALYYNALHAITLQCHGIVVVRYLLYCLSCNKTKSHGNIFSNSTALHYIVLHYIYITLQWAGIVVVRFLLYCLPCNKTKSHKVTSLVYYIALHYITLQCHDIVEGRFLLYCLPCNKTKSGAASLYYLHPHRPNHLL